MRLYIQPSKQAIVKADWNSAVCPISVKSGVFFIYHKLNSIIVDKRAPVRYTISVVRFSLGSLFVMMSFNPRNIEAVASSIISNENDADGSNIIYLHPFDVVFVE